MKKLATILLFTVSIFAVGQQPLTIHPNGAGITVNQGGNSITVVTNPNGTISLTASFSFMLSQPAMTSAGIFKGDTLISTLWSLQYYSAGRHDTLVTGLDENNNQLSNGTYTIKVVSNNAGFAQIGTYMNSSTLFHGSNTWRGELMSNMSFLGGHGYCGISYSEDAWPIFRFSINNVNSKDLISGKESYTYSGFSATDNNLVYWVTRASGQVGTGRIFNFIYATDSNGVEHTFPNGQGFNVGGVNPHISVVDTLGDHVNNTARDCYGFTVQKNGDYMYTVRGVGIYVTNKNGQHVMTLPITDGGQMKIDQTNDTTAWLIEGSQVKRYKINTDGSLSYFGITISGMTTPLALDISPTDNTLKVEDGGTQQVWFFNKSNGNFIRTLGRLNGYYGNVIVNDTAFMFTNDFTAYPQFITHQSDGSFWVCDNGNNRYQHFTANGTYINNIHWLDRTYNLYADENDSTALYYKASMAKININASTPEIGSTAAKNYMGRMPTVYGAYGFYDIFNIGGHKFTTISIVGDKQIVELQDTGLRYTGIHVSTLNGSGKQQFAANGDLLEHTATYANSAVASWFWATKTCTGLDGSNNPTYAANFVTNAAVGGSTNQPVSGNLNNLRAKLSNGVIIGLNDHGSASGYHLGAIKQGGTSWLWLDQPSTFQNYSGDFPKDYFDIGNAVNDNAGGEAVVKDDIIYTVYHGENWKNRQTNMLNVYDKSGLEIAQFGVVGTRAEDGDAPYWLTGNTGNMVVQHIGSEVLIVENDESKCGGLMVTKSTNINSVHIDSFNVVVNGLTAIPSGTTSDLLNGFMYDALINSTEADLWTFSSPYYDSSTINGHFWYLRTNYGTYARNMSPDVYMGNFGQDNFGDCSLPYVQGNNWQLSQNIALPDVANGMFWPSSFFYYRIKDAAGKVIVQISVENQTYGVYGQPHNLKVNNQTIYTDSTLDQNLVNIPLMNYLSITRMGANITFTYRGQTITTPIFDSSADAGQPATLALEHFAGGAGGTMCDISGMIFNSNKQ